MQVTTTLAVTLMLQATLAAAVAAFVAPASAEETATTSETGAVLQGRGYSMKTIMMNPYMLIPQLISLGFAPIVLANLKMMVMSALMVNNMALNAAIFMTIRNIVFGSRPKVKYVNYGYRERHHNDHHHNNHYQQYQQHHDHRHNDYQQQRIGEHLQHQLHDRRVEHEQQQSSQLQSSWDETQSTVRRKRTAR